MNETITAKKKSYKYFQNILDTQNSLFLNQYYRTTHRAEPWYCPQILSIALEFVVNTPLGVGTLRAHTWHSSLVITAVAVRELWSTASEECISNSMLEWERISKFLYTFGGE